MAGVVLVAQHKESAGSDEPTGSMRAIVGLSLVASLGFAIAFTSGQAAVVVFGEAQAVWLARGFGIMTVVLAYIAPGTRFDMPVRWLPVIAAMGLLDVGALIAVTTAGTARSCHRHRRLIRLRRGQRDPGVDLSPRENLAPAVSRDRADLPRRRRARQPVAPQARAARFAGSGASTEKSRS
jgi:hypothetical protein